MIYRLMAAHRFPAPVQLSTRAGVAAVGSGTVESCKQDHLALRSGFGDECKRCSKVFRQARH
ncbi:hypothetical protein PO768_27745 [Paucibacter sp. XJ19-41]|nr:hypothetical protein [Paucibacter sp. XJ19-41]MDC6171218.1 hypothetical protein [Paucibacter sp. XJ19-41]